MRASSALNLASLLWTMTHGVASLRITKPTFPWPPVEQQVDELLDVILRGICTAR